MPRHPSHETRFSMDASTYDEVCVNCGATDKVPGGWGLLAEPCAAVESKSPVSEKEFQHQVVQLARLLGWAVAHFRKVRVQRKGGACYYETPVAADGAGWPDLVLCKPGVGVLYRELKTDAGRLEPAQGRWLEALARAGADAKCWRPRDWAEIERTLRGE